MRKKRSSAQLMRDMLLIIHKKKAINTKTLTAANMSSEMQRQYVKKATEAGLIKQEGIEKNHETKIIWDMTDKGHEFVNEYNSFVRKYPFVE